WRWATRGGPGRTAQDDCRQAADVESGEALTWRARTLTEHVAREGRQRGQVAEGEDDLDHALRRDLPGRRGLGLAGLAEAGRNAAQNVFVGVVHDHSKTKTVDWGRRIVAQEERRRASRLVGG